MIIPRGLLFPVLSGVAGVFLAVCRVERSLCMCRTDLYNRLRIRALVVLCDYVRDGTGTPFYGGGLFWPATANFLREDWHGFALVFYSRVYYGPWDGGSRLAVILIRIIPAAHCFVAVVPRVIIRRAVRFVRLITSVGVLRLRIRALVLL